MHAWIGGCMDVLMYAFLVQVNVADKDGRFNHTLHMDAHCITFTLIQASLPISSGFADLVTFPALSGPLRKQMLG